MDLDLIAKYDRPVPRYTSYPTAPHFGPTVDAACYRRWLEELDPGERASLYIHIPFCHALCWFCGCHTKVVRRYRPVAAYVELLRREIDLAAGRIGGRLSVDHVHFGGGSPDILAADDFLALIDHLRARFAFAEGAEIAVELDPRGVMPETVRALAEAGVRRASLGVQDFDPAVQQAVNRVQPFDLTQAVVDRLRAAGIVDINLDLMYGLPCQSAAGLVRTVDKAVALEPRRLALFAYAHVPWMRPHQRLIDETRLPGPAERWRQFQAASARLEERGYVAVGLDHFARPDNALAGASKRGRLHRNFQGYTTDDAAVLIGFGASAIGTLPQGYVQNAVPLGTYRDAISRGDLAVYRGLAVSPDDRLRRAIIERLMCDLEVDLAAVCAAHGDDPPRFDPELEALARMAEDGIVTISGHRIRVSEECRPLLRVVAAVFDRHLANGEGRYSRPV